MLKEGDKVRLLDVKRLKVDRSYKDNDEVELMTLGMFPEHFAIAGEDVGAEDVYLIPRDSKYIEKV